MKNYQNIVTALDLTDMDSTLLNYAKYFGSLSKEGASHCFVHVIPTYVFPTNVQDLVHGIDSPGFKLDSLVEANISRSVSEKFGAEPNGRFEIAVEEGQPFKTILGTVKKLKADLLLMGRKKVSEGSGIVSKMIARHVACDVCFVAENGNPDLSNLLVPMDFSPNSIKALKQAAFMAAGKPGTNIHVLHVLDFPPTTQYLTRSYGLLAADWQERVNLAFSVCLKQNEIPDEGIHFHAVKNEYFNTAEHIREHAEKVGAGLILLGAQGHNSFDDFFLGSVAEKLVSIVDSVPVLIVR